MFIRTFPSYLWSRVIGSIFIRACDEDEVLSTVSSLRNTAAGIRASLHHISSSILLILYVFLSHISAISLSFMALSQIHLKCPVLSLSSKPVDEQLVNNYRPISILPFLSKVLETNCSLAFMHFTLRTV